MNHNIMHVVTFRGQYEEVGQYIFTTDSSYEAMSYCVKGNKILRKYRKHFTDKFNNLRMQEDRGDEEDYYNLSERVNFVNGIFSRDEVPLRIKQLKPRL